MQLSVEGYDYDTCEAPQQTWDTEYIKMRRGEQRVTRQRDPASQEYTFTVLIQSFCERRNRNVAVRLPVHALELPKNGAQCDIRSTLLMEKLGSDGVEFPAILTKSQRINALRRLCVDNYI